MAKKELVSRFIKFLNDELHEGNLSEESIESLEVAKQCLETSYEIDSSSLDSSLPSLLEVLKQTSQSAPVTLVNHDIPDYNPTAEEKERADKLKTQGNSCMTKEMYAEAVNCYTKAIEINPRNAVFYCNRAAAYSKMKNHQAAITDCERALQIDSNYCKAYSRMGFAYCESGNHAKAVELYQKTLEFEPNNESYKQQLAVADALLHNRLPPTSANLPNSTSTRTAGTVPGGEFPGLGGNMNLAGLLNNPQLMNMATQMMANPQMQQFMSNLMSGAASQQGGGAGLDSILNMGQQIAQQMQQSNPEMVEMLRQRQRGAADASSTIPAASEVTNNNTEHQDPDNNQDPPPNDE